MAFVECKRAGADAGQRDEGGGGGESTRRVFDLQRWAQRRGVLEAPSSSSGNASGKPHAQDWQGRKLRAYPSIPLCPAVLTLSFLQTQQRPVFRGLRGLALIALSIQPIKMVRRMGPLTDKITSHNGSLGGGGGVLGRQTIQVAPPWEAIARRLSKRQHMVRRTDSVALRHAPFTKKQTLGKCNPLSQIPFFFFDWLDTSLPQPSFNSPLV